MAGSAGLLDNPKITRVAVHAAMRSLCSLGGSITLVAVRAGQMTHAGDLGNLFYTFVTGDTLAILSIHLNRQ